MDDEQRKLIDAVNLVCNYISAHIPHGWSIRMTSGHEEGWIELLDPADVVIDVDSGGDYGVSVIADLCEEAHRLHPTNSP